MLFVGDKRHFGFTDSHCFSTGHLGDLHHWGVRSLARPRLDTRIVSPRLDGGNDF